MRSLALAVLTAGVSLSAACGALAPPPHVTRFNQAKGFDGWVRTIAPALDGSGDVYIGGEFTTYDSRSADHLVRMHRDGTLDERFGGFRRPVVSVAPAPDGSVYVVEEGGYQRAWRLRHDGTIDPDFAPQSYTVGITPALDGSADIFVATAGMAGSLERLHSDGSVDNTFTSPQIEAYGVLGGSIAATDGTGDLFLWGSFGTVDGEPTHGLVRLHGDGTVATRFAGAADDTSAGAIALATDGTGAIYANYDDGSGGVVRLRADGAVDTAFARPKLFDRAVSCIVPMADGAVYVAGWSDDWPRMDVLRLESDGTLDSSFTGSSVDEVQTSGLFDAYGVDLTMAAATDGSGDLFVGGDFTAYAGTGVNGFMRLHADGTLAASTHAGTGFDVIFEGFDDLPASRSAYGPVDIAVPNDGTGDLYVSGMFTKYDGVPENGLVQLHGDGTRDDTFATTATSASGEMTFLVVTPANDGTGDVWAGGDISAVDGTPANGLARLHADGSVDRVLAANVCPKSACRVTTITLANDGTGDVYVGGNLFERLHDDATVDPTFVGDADVLGVTPAIGTNDVYVAAHFVDSSHLLRLHHDGTRDGAFAPAGLEVTSPPVMAADGSGDVLVGGSVPTAGGARASGLVRLHADGTVAFVATVCDGGTCWLTHVAPTADGSNDFYVDVSSSSAPDHPRERLVRVHADGTTATTFDSGYGFDGFVFDVAPATDGTGDVFVVGSFRSYRTTTVDHIVRLDSRGSLK